MASLVGKKISEVYTQLIVRDAFDYFLYTGDGVNTRFSVKFGGQIAGNNGTSVWSDTTIPAHNDPARTGSYGFGLGFTAFSANYPAISSVSNGSTLSAAPQARLILGTLGAQTLKTSDPVAYANTRTYSVITKELTATGDKVSLKSQDNADGLNSFSCFESFTPHSGGTHYTQLANDQGGSVRVESNTIFYANVPTGTMNLGAASAKWKELFCANGTINTSDGRLKSAPKVIDDSALDAWGDVSIIAFQWLDAIKEKGIDARWHTGVIAQQVRDAFAARGLDGTRYGLLCYDKWDEVTEPVYEIIRKVVKKTNELGELVDDEIIEQRDTGDVKVIREAGDLWGIRADQCLFMEAAYQRRRCDRIEKRLSNAGL